MGFRERLTLLKKHISPLAVQHTRELLALHYGHPAVARQVQGEEQQGGDL